jgi:hypothetical protein
MIGVDLRKNGRHKWQIRCFSRRKFGDLGGKKKRFQKNIKKLKERFRKKHAEIMNSYGLQEQ